MRRRCLVLLLAAAIGGFAAPAAAAPAATRPVLLLSMWGTRLDPAVEKRLRDDGFELVVRRLAEPLTAEVLRLFPAVVLPDYSGAQCQAFMPRQYVTDYLAMRDNLALLRRYVEDGGGLLVCPFMTGGGPEVAENCASLLEPWGAALVCGQVRDDERAALGGEYSWTTAVEPSPLSKGVQRLLYPTNQLRWDDAYSTLSFALAAGDWRAIVRGMPGSVVAKGVQYTTWLPMAGISTPAIVAARQAGRGRVVLCGINSFYTLLHGFEDVEKGWIGESKTGRIDGAVLGRTTGEERSDGMALLANCLAWQAEAGVAAGFGGYTQERLAAMPAPAAPPAPGWLGGWRSGNGGRPVKTLVGARSSFSDGTGSIAEHAAAARRAGYGVLAMTETFEAFAPARWSEFCAACREATAEDLVVLPGIDIADVYGNRFLVVGTTIYPERVALAADGRSLRLTQYLSLGFGTHFTVIHRPSSTPMPHELYKFFAGISVSTYKGGTLVDDGMLAYQWHVNNVSQPLPVAVHEVFSPREVEEAAEGDRQQLFLMADSPASAAWYLRPGMQHFWESPALFLVSSGPRVLDLWAGGITAESDAPITDVQLVSQHVPLVRWRTSEPRVELTWHLPPARLHAAFVHVQDARGRTAITPVLRMGKEPRYTWRCSDRQNFFGFAMNYTGTRLPDIDPLLPVFGTREGQGLWPSGAGPRRGENLAPLLEFPYVSPAATITEATIDQRYWQALWEDVAFDGKPSRGTAPSRVYGARVRYLDFGISEQWREKDPQRPMIIKDAEVRLKIPALPTGDVFPVLTTVGRGPAHGFFDAAAGRHVAGRLTSGHVDLPVGGHAGNLVALSPGLRVNAAGEVGWAAPTPAVPLPKGTAWSARYVRIPETTAMEDALTLMGFAGPPPFAIRLTRGSGGRLAYQYHAACEGGGIAGTVAPATKPGPEAKDAPADGDRRPPAMFYRLPLALTGVEPNWDAGVWRARGEIEYFGVFEGTGYAALDVTTGGDFYAGNLIRGSVPAIHLSILRWDADGIAVEAINPTAAELETTLETPPEITGRYRLSQRAAVPPGRTVVLEFRK